MTCNRCEVHELANETKAAGGEIYVAPPDEFGGIDVFVIPKGKKQDFALRHDNTCSPQRKLWVNGIPDECECGSNILLESPMTYVLGKNAKVKDPTEVPEEIIPLSLL